jgi:hypothetical protein
VSRDAHTPAQRADAVLRAAEAAAAAAQAAAAAAHAASLPEPAPPPAVVATAEPAPPPAVVVPAEPAPAPAEPAPPPEPPIHEAGAAGRLLAAAGDLEAHVAQARAQLDALEDALGRLERYDAPAD